MASPAPSVPWLKEPKGDSITNSGATSAQPEDAAVKKIIPRLYQQELFEAACKENVIAFLDTGSGKTLIAVLLIKHMAEKGRKLKNKVTIFLAPKVDLVLQQANVLGEHTGLATKGYVGSMGVDSWKPHAWMSEIQKQDLFVMTPQLLLNALRHGFVKLSDVNLLVFDECHHAKKDHAYNCIMREMYFSLEKSDRPHIFGMTASPMDNKMGGDLNQVGGFFSTLEHNLDAKVVTVADRSLLEQVAPLPSTKILQYPHHATNSKVEEAYEKLVQIQNNLKETGDEARRLRQQLDLEAQGLGEMKTNFDQEKAKTQCHKYSRHVGNIIYTIKDMGVFAGALCLLEILKAGSRKANNQAQNKRPEKSNTLSSRYVDSDGGFSDIEDDTWWWGARAPKTKYADMSQKFDTDVEVLSLSRGMWEVTEVLASLLSADSQEIPALPSDEEVQRMGWAKIALDLVEHTKNMVGGVDSRQLDKQLMKPTIFRERDLGEEVIIQHSESCYSTKQDKASVQNAGSTEIPLVSPKLAALCTYLLSYKDTAEQKPGGQGENRAKWSCIIFAKRRFMALTLHWLLQNSRRLRHIASAAIMGSNKEGSSRLQRVQTQILGDFKTGKLNTLIATAVAEEGLDLTQCRLVVRYDLPSTPLEFIQSRGRARARNSKIVLMIQEQNAEELAMMCKIHGCEDSMRAEAINRRLDPEVGEADSDDEGLEMADKDDYRYIVPSTGASVTLVNAKSLLYQYCSNLPSDKYTQLIPRFSTLTSDDEPKSYQTTVFLPNNAPVQSATGKVMPKRNLAIKSASLAVLIALHKVGGLNDHLQLDAGVRDAGRDAFAKFDDCEVRPAVKDPRMPSRAAIACHPPEALTWPPDHSKTAEETGEVSVWLYWLELKSKFPRHLSKSVLEKSVELEQQIGLLTPGRLPKMPGVPNELLPGVVTHMHLREVGQLKMPQQDYKLAQQWHEIMCNEGNPYMAARVKNILRREARRSREEGKKKRKHGAEEPPSAVEKAKNLPKSTAKTASAPSDAAPSNGVQAPQPCNPAAGNAQSHPPPTSQTPAEVHQENGRSTSQEDQASKLPPAKRHKPDKGHSVRFDDGGETAKPSEQHPGMPPCNGEKAHSGQKEATIPSKEPEMPSIKETTELADGMKYQPHYPNLGRVRKDGEHGWYCFVPLKGKSRSKMEIDLAPLKHLQNPGVASGGKNLGGLSEEDLQPLIWDAVVTTSYNNWQYDVMGIEQGVTLDSKMSSKGTYRKKQLSSDPADEHGRDPSQTKDVKSVRKSRWDVKESTAKGSKRSTRLGDEMEDGELQHAHQQHEQSGVEENGDDAVSYSEYYRKRWQVKDLQPTSFMLKCTSKAVQRRQEEAQGKQFEYGELSVLLPPQLCMLHPLKRRSLLIAKHLPRLLWWINAMTVADELQDRLHVPGRQNPDLMLLVEALTPTHCQPDFSYERLETLGDGFLKYDTCLHVFHAMPNAHEGQLAESKQSVISNSNLARLGYWIKIAPFMNTSWKYTDWSSRKYSQAQLVGQKVVADCIEAMIGAHYVAGGEVCASAFMRRIGLMPELPKIAREFPQPDRAGQSSSSRRLEGILGYKFRSLSLLKEACTHCSWPDQSAKCYQRLEFLGDAALDLLISRYYIMSYRDVEPGKMHDLRSASVNNNRLAIIAAWHKLYPFMRYFSQKLFSEVAPFVSSVKAAKNGTLPELPPDQKPKMKMKTYKKHSAAFSYLFRLSTWAGRDPENTIFPESYHDAMRTSDRETWRISHSALDRESIRDRDLEDDRLEKFISAGFGIRFAAAPKALGDLFESIAGAIFLDSGGDLETLWKVIRPFLEPLVHPNKVPCHPVRALIELCQKNGLQVGFKKVDCEEEGCYSVAAVIGSRTVGLCTSSATKDNARMMSAEDALQNWTPELCKELQALPQVGLRDASRKRNRNEDSTKKPKQPSSAGPSQARTATADNGPPAKKVKFAAEDPDAKTSKVTASHADLEQRNKSPAHDHFQEPVAQMAASLPPNASQKELTDAPQKLQPGSGPSSIAEPGEILPPKKENCSTNGTANSLLVEAAAPVLATWQASQTSKPGFLPGAAEQGTVSEVQNEQSRDIERVTDSIDVATGTSLQFGQQPRVSPGSSRADTPVPGELSQFQSNLPALTSILKIPKEWLARMQGPQA